jgi:hypothetical protein
MRRSERAPLRPPQIGRNRCHLVSALLRELSGRSLGAESLPARQPSCDPSFPPTAIPTTRALIENTLMGTRSSNTTDTLSKFESCHLSREPILPIRTHASKFTGAFTIFRMCEGLIGRSLQQYYAHGSFALGRIASAAHSVANCVTTVCHFNCFNDLLTTFMLDRLPLYVTA